MYSQNVSIPPDYFAWRFASSPQPNRCTWTETDADVGEQQTSKLLKEYNNIN